MGILRAWSRQSGHSCERSDNYTITLRAWSLAIGEEPDYTTHLIAWSLAIVAEFRCVWIIPICLSVVIGNSCRCVLGSTIIPHIFESMVSATACPRGPQSYHFLFVRGHCGNRLFWVAYRCELFHIAWSLATRAVRYRTIIPHFESMVFGDRTSCGHTILFVIAWSFRQLFCTPPPLELFHICFLAPAVDCSTACGASALRPESVLSWIAA